MWWRSNESPDSRITDTTGRYQDSFSTGLEIFHAIDR